MNFCVASLILKIEKKKRNIFSILWFIISRKVKTQPKCKKRFVQCIEKVLWLIKTCQRWFAKFRAGDISLNGAPPSGRPVEVDKDQIKTLIENNRHYTMREISDILRISKSSVENHLHQLGYVNLFDVWVPRKLSEKTFLTVFPHAILYLNIMKTFRF